MTGNMINENRNQGPGIFHTTVSNQGPVNLGHFEPSSFGFLNDPMYLRNQQPNQPILFRTGNQIPALQPLDSNCVYKKKLKMGGQCVNKPRVTNYF
jgi:hypothetical protein